MNRLWPALTLLAVLAALAWGTLSDYRIRLGTVVVLGFFAAKVYIAHRRRDVDPEGPVGTAGRE